MFAVLAAGPDSIEPARPPVCRGPGRHAVRAALHGEF